MTSRATITGWGKCLPPVKLTNADLEKLVDTDHDWIVSRTGIHERRITHVETTDMAEVAARRALAAAGYEPTDMDLLILATLTPEITCPSNACVLQERLGATNAGAFDLNAACSGWLYGTATTSSMIAAGAARRVLLVGAEKLHFVVDYWDRSICILFGDGAGAAVFEASTNGDGVLSTDLGADGATGNTMVFPTLGTRGGLHHYRDPADNRLHFEGQAVFKIAVQGMERSVRTALARAGVEPDEVSLVVPHQANGRIIEAVARRLGLGMDRVMVNIATHGNTAAASIPMALTDALHQGRISAGDLVVQTGFGGGVTWGSTVIRWGDRVTPLGYSDAELPPCDKSVFELIQSHRDFYAPLYPQDSANRSDPPPADGSPSENAGEAASNGHPGEVLATAQS